MYFISKETRNSIVSSSIKLAKVMIPIKDECKLSDAVYKIHNVIPFIILLLFIIITNKIWQLTIIILFILFFISNIILNGCLVSMVELKLCENSRIPIDSYLDLFSIPPTSYNRKLGTKIIFILLISFMCCYFYFIHYYNRY
jgi:hypothetical protein